MEVEFDLQHPIKLYWEWGKTPENCISRLFPGLFMQKREVLRVQSGNSVNCTVYEGGFCVHAHCTHTENVSHISRTQEKLHLEPFFKVYLFPSIERALKSTERAIGCKGIVLRCSDVNAFLPVELGVQLNKTCSQIMHLFTNVASVDEVQSKSLDLHCSFLHQNAHRTITELCNIPRHLEEGIYLMNVNVWDFDSGASPSFPVLFPRRK